jgi:hypothetical protein
MLFVGVIDKTPLLSAQWEPVSIGTSDPPLARHKPPRHRLIIWVNVTPYMKAKAHTAMVAGASSCVVASWIRSQTVTEFDPVANTPRRSELIARRLPMVAAGIGFTWLTATVSGYFDTAELKVLSDSSDVRPLHQRLEHHRELHSLPFLGEALTTTHLLRHGAQHLGNWLAARLEVPDRASAVIDALEGLAEWVINSIGTGIWPSAASGRYAPRRRRSRSRAR